MKIKDVEQRIRGIEIEEELALLFHVSARFGNINIRVIYNAREARALSADLLVWLREPTPEERIEVRPALIARNGTEIMFNSERKLEIKLRDENIPSGLQGLEEKLQTLQTKLAKKYPDLPEEIQDELEFCERAMYHLRVQVFEHKTLDDEDPFRSRYNAMD